MARGSSTASAACRGRVCVTGRTVTTVSPSSSMAVRMMAQARFYRLPHGLARIRSAKDTRNGRPNQALGPEGARLLEFAVEMPMPWVHIRFGNRIKFGVGQIARVEHLTRAAAEATVFLGREHDQALAAVARDGDGLHQRLVLVAPEMALEFGGGDGDYIQSISRLRNLRNKRGSLIGVTGNTPGWFPPSRGKVAGILPRVGAVRGRSQVPAN